MALLAGLPAAVEFTDGTEPVLGAALHTAAGRAFTIATPVRISESAALTLDSGRVSLPDRGGAAADNLRVAQIDDAKLTLNLAQPAAATAPPSGPETAAASIPSIAGFSVGAMRLRRATISIVGPGGQAMSVSDVDATVTASRKGSHKLIGSGNYNGQQIAFDATWSEAAARSGSQQMPLRLTLSTAYVEASIDGHVSTAGAPTFDGRAVFRLPSLKRFVRWSGLGNGAREHVRSVSVSGPVNWTTARMAFSRAVLDIDGNQATGALTINHGAERLVIDGTLAFEELDLGRYWQSRPQGEAGKAAPGTPHFLATFDADLRLSAGRIRTPLIQTGRGAVTIALTGGRLQADFAGIEVEDGTAEGQLKLDVNDATPKAGFKVKIRGVDAGRLLAASLKPNSLLGRTNVTLDGAAEGHTLPEALTTLTGRGQFELAEPGRLGLDLAALIYAARGSTVVGWSSAGKGSTGLDSLSGRFRVLNGAVSLEGVQARTGTTTLIAGGRLDVPARLMDMTIASGPGAQGEAPVTVQDALVLRGNWDNPAISLVKPERPSTSMKAEVPLGSSH